MQREEGGGDFNGAGQRKKEYRTREKKEGGSFDPVYSLDGWRVLDDAL